MLTRAQFFERLDSAIARAKLGNQLIGVMLLNLDHFKELNARGGRLLGDWVLVKIAERLGRCTRKGDVIARIGDDEFAVILAGLTHTDGATLATARLLVALSPPLPLKDRDLVVTATIGVAFYPVDGEDSDTLLQNADFAVSHAREYTRNTCRFYSPALRAQTREREAWCAKVARQLASLTPRERQVGRLLVAGNSNKRIGHTLGASTRTIDNHRASIMRKMAAHSLPELVRMIIEVRGDVAEVAPLPQDGLNTRPST